MRVEGREGRSGSTRVGAARSDGAVGEDKEDAAEFEALVDVKPVEGAAAVPGEAAGPTVRARERRERRDAGIVAERDMGEGWGAGGGCCWQACGMGGCCC